MVLNTASNLLDHYNVQEFIMAQRVSKNNVKMYTFYLKLFFLFWTTADAYYNSNCAMIDSYSLGIVHMYPDSFLLQLFCFGYAYIIFVYLYPTIFSS